MLTLAAAAGAHHQQVEVGGDRVRWQGGLYGVAIIGNAALKNRHSLFGTPAARGPGRQRLVQGLCTDLHVQECEALSCQRLPRLNVARCQVWSIKLVLSLGCAALVRATRQGPVLHARCSNNDRSGIRPSACCCVSINACV